MPTTEPGFPRLIVRNASNDETTGEPMYQYIDEQRDDRKIICHAHTYGYRPEMARLMAAAPDLLAALEHITQYAFDDDTPTEDILADMESMKDVARDAIDRATGKDSAE